MDLPSKVWKSIPIRILCQTTYYRHQFHVTQKTGAWDVKDICTIVLLDSEVNHTYKHIGKGSMRAAMYHRQIASEQYSRPQRTDMAHGINRRLVFDYQQYLWQPFSLACSYLKFCYDIFVHLYSSLALQRLGITLPEIITMLDTIQCMLRMVTVSCGDCDLTHRGDSILDEFRYFITGIFRGNYSAPQICLIKNSVVFSAFRSQGFGIHFVNYFTA